MDFTKVSPAKLKEILPFLSPPEQALVRRIIDPQPAKRMLDFSCFMTPSYRPENFHSLLCLELDKVLAGNQRFTIITAPPQHGKSSATSVHFPAMHLGMYPDIPIIISSYGSDLANEKSSQVRDLVESTEFSEVFKSVKTREDSRAVNMWKIEGHRAFVRASGVGGGLTGHGAGCFPAGTMVLTEKGPLDIAHLDQLQSKKNICSLPKVWAYDHASGNRVLRNIVATREIKTNDLVEIITASGATLRATLDHPIYVPGYGYKEAAFLSRGDRLTRADFPQKQSVPAMRATKKGSRNIVPGLLQPGAGQGTTSRMRLVSQAVHQTTLRDRETSKKRLQRLLLLQKLHRSSPCNQERSPLCSLPESYARGERPEILLRGVPEDCCQDKARKDLPVVRGNISGKELAHPVLRQILCRRGPLTQDEGYWQLSLQNRDELRTLVCSDAPTNQGARPVSLRYLPHRRNINQNTPERPGYRQDKPENTPHQRAASRQYSNQPYNPVCDLSSKCTPLAPVEEDTVELVRYLHTPDLSVYDLQVEGCHNFFAEGLLVHNCGIIDDPFKDEDEAYSPTIREKVWRWYNTAFKNRIWPGGKQVIILTRWHPDDLVGRIMNTPGWERWKVVRLPAVAEEQSIRDRNNLKYNLPPGLLDPIDRLPGEPLCPDLRPLDFLEEIQETYTATQWSALYQGAPGVADGNLIKREWLENNIVDFVPLPDKGIFRVIAWDKAGTDRSSNKRADFSVGLLMTYDSNTGDFYIESLVRGQWSSEKRGVQMEEYAEETEKKYEFDFEIWHEQEPGSGGKESAEITDLRMAKYTIHHQTSTGTKEARGRPFVAACERGKMHLLRGAWNNTLIDEVISFPAGEHDDIWDASTLAYNKLVLKKPKRKTRVH
jgi:predicted phage terminase large subunit-like protein